MASDSEEAPFNPDIWTQDPRDPRYLPVCSECLVCRSRMGLVSRPVHEVPKPVYEEPVPTYEEAEAIRLLSIAKPLDPTKEQLEDLWSSTLHYFLRGPRWLFMKTMIWLAKKSVEIKSTDDTAKLDYKYRKSISQTMQNCRRSDNYRVIKSEIGDKKDCRFHRRNDCYCGQLKLNSGDTAYFNWKAFLCEDRLEFF